MLIRAHVLLITAGILFCFGLALHQLLAFRHEAGKGSPALAIFFLAAGIGLGFYLKTVIRKFFRKD
ncbi:MAG: hypothetical protein HY717_12330 [Planctomycetes bacterium]|nr:hypothetical protein [Planctomycetota bacterium]